MNTYVQETDGSSRRVNIVSSGSLFICGSLALNNSPERNVFYQVRALEGAWERALDGDFEATSGKNKENVKPVQQRQEIESTEPRKSWIETAAAAGVVTMVQANGENAVEEYPNCEKDAKKKTPKQYRCQPPKVKTGKQLTVAEKKLFKEAFNTDKARLHKRQQKFQKEPNFLIIMEDNILGPGAATSGKMMVYGQGKMKESFLSGNLKFDQ